jgi:hypothetical protein
VVETVDTVEDTGAEEGIGANDRPVRERKQTNFLADAMRYPASTKSYHAQFLQDSDRNDQGLREAVENMKQNRLVKHRTSIAVSQWHNHDADVS